MNNIINNDEYKDKINKILKTGIQMILGIVIVNNMPNINNLKQMAIMIIIYGICFSLLELLIPDVSLSMKENFYLLFGIKTLTL